MITRYRDDIGHIKQKHRNSYIGHLSKNYEGDVEIIDFDPLIKSAYDITSFILREQPEIKVEVGDAGHLVLSDVFANP